MDNGWSPLIRGFLVATIAAVALVAFSACDGSGQDQGRTEDSRQENRATTGTQQTGASANWEAVGQAIGKEGKLKDGGVYSVSWPRSDLSVSSQGVEIDPALALGSHAEFFSVGEDEALLRGDLVLTEEEYNRVIPRLQEGGIGQSAIHKHLPDESPPIWWTHISGRGDPVEMARTIRAALEMTGTPMEAGGGSGQGELPLDTGRLDEIIGYKGKASSGVYKYSIPRAERVAIDGVEVPAAMGTAIPLNFQPTSQGRAVINGDFIMTAKEVDPVIRALRQNDIQVVSLHNHFLTDEPRLFFLHFWAKGDPQQLAKGLRAALDEVEVAAPEEG